MNKLVIYTAIFGKKDSLPKPLYVPDGCDFICFTDQDFHSGLWKINKIERPLPDPTRSARKYKILAHRFLPEYEYSLWIDGNVVIRGNVNELIQKYLSNYNIAVFDHAQSREMPLGSLKEGLQRLLEMERVGKHQDNPDIMERQAKAYFKEGFPDNNGLLWSLALLRRHNKPDVVKLMEAWWGELEKWSKRDQMSFNYVAWKYSIKFVYMHGDPADTHYFRRISHYLPWHRKIYSCWLGGIKRLKRIAYKILWEK